MLSRAHAPVRFVQQFPHSGTQRIGGAHIEAKHTPESDGYFVTRSTFTPEVRDRHLQLFEGGAYKAE
jgi:hypothetical protein